MNCVSIFYSFQIEGISVSYSPYVLDPAMSLLFSHASVDEKIANGMAIESDSICLSRNALALILCAIESCQQVGGAPVN